MTPTIKFTCPYCNVEQIPKLTPDGGMVTGSLMLCGCEESYKAEERKHREQMEIRLRNRPVIKRRNR